jgi:hypothetical protein
VAAAWDRVHPRLNHRAAWLDHDGPLPVIEGTLIRLQAGHLPGDRGPKPVWLWWSRTGAAPAEVDRCWQSFLRRFDLEHIRAKTAQPASVDGHPRRQRGNEIVVDERGLQRFRRRRTNPATSGLSRQIATTAYR